MPATLELDSLTEMDPEIPVKTSDPPPCAKRPKVAAEGPGGAPRPRKRAARTTQEWDDNWPYKPSMQEDLRTEAHYTPATPACEEPAGEFQKETLPEAPAPRKYSSEEQAIVLRRFTALNCIQSAVPNSLHVDCSGCAAFLEKFMKDAGDPKDPIEIILLEQLAIFHFRLGDLQTSATRAGAIEATEAYHGMSIRLAAELRKSALALESYRMSRAIRLAK